MSKNVLLMVDYGVNNSIHVGLFKIHFKEAGWREGFLEGTFEKSMDLPDAVIEKVVQEEFDSAANQASFKKTYCELFVTEDELKFSWDWNTP